MSAPTVTREILQTLLDSAADARRTLVCALGSVADHSNFKRNPTARVIQDADPQLLPWSISCAYWSLRATDSRVAGLVFTPPDVAASVVDRLRPDYPVVDLGAGTGMLAIEAARRGFTVTAIERDPELASVVSSLAKILGLNTRIRVLVGDALAYSRRSTAQLMSNPPYSRYNALGSGLRDQLCDLANQLEIRLPLNSPHYAYFMAYAWRARWSKRENLLVPTNWLETKYGEALRGLAEGIRQLDITPVGSSWLKTAFRHARTTSCIVTSERSASGLSLNGHAGSGVRRLVRLDRWKTMKHSSQPLRVPKRRNSDRSTTLRDICRVKRGIATGANDLFFISLEDASKSGLPARELVPALRTLSPNAGARSVGFIWKPTDPPSRASLARIKAGEEMKLHERVLCKTRRPWWRVASSPIPPYLLTYMGKRDPAVLPNVWNLANLNNVHGIFPEEGTSGQVVAALVIWLNSREGRRALLKEARHYEGGLWKLEPSDAEAVLIPAHIVHGRPSSEETLFEVSLAGA